MIKIGLTGGIATGKSTAARALRSLRIEVIDADQVARDVVQPGTEGLREVVERFGTGVLADDGSLDRKALGAIVVDDADARRDLEAMLHHRIRGSIRRRMVAREATGSTPMMAVEAALLVETGSYREYDELWVVTCHPAIQLKRLMAREGIAEAQARKWLATQPPLVEKEAVATRVFRNDGSPAELAEQIRLTVNELLEWEFAPSLPEDWQERGAQR